MSGEGAAGPREVIVAEHAGFCFGVRRAIEIALGAAREAPPAFTLGPLIHNPQEVERLSREGLRVARSLEEVPPGATLVIPSHGSPPEALERARAVGITLVDATCPLVRRCQELAEEHRRVGLFTVVVGDPSHTEVRGILGHAGPQAIAVPSPEALPVKLPPEVGVICQTTQTAELLSRVAAELSRRGVAVRLHNTICKGTVQRRRAAAELARRVDAMVVVGGRISSNTRRLAEACAATGTPTLHVETAAQVDEAFLGGARRIGVTAGASTPDWVIEEVVAALRSAGR